MLDTASLYDAFDDGDCLRIDAWLATAKRDINMRSDDSDGWNLLHMALMSVTRMAHPGVIGHLIDRGVNVNAKDRRLWTPLHFAVRNGCAPAVRMLIDAGANIDSADDEGLTPLHRSFVGNPWNLEIVEMLLAAGAKLTDMSLGYISAVADPKKGELLGLLAKYQRA